MYFIDIVQCWAVRIFGNKQLNSFSWFSPRLILLDILKCLCSGIWLGIILLVNIFAPTKLMNNIGQYNFFNITIKRQLLCFINLLGIYRSKVVKNHSLFSTIWISIIFILIVFGPLETKNEWKIEKINFYHYEQY